VHSKIRDAHYTVVDDLAYLIPNLNITTRADNTLDVVMRGVGGFGITPGVGFYVNDVQLFEGRPCAPKISSASKCSRSAGNALWRQQYRRSHQVHHQENPPHYSPQKRAVEGGKLQYAECLGCVSGPIAGDYLDARLSAFDTTSDGFVFDPTLNRHLGRDKQRGARFTLEYPPER